jgi:hypothetical protein
MANQSVPISNWTLATGSKPGERHVYRDTPRNPVTHPTAIARAHDLVRDDEIGRGAVTH